MPIFLSLQIDNWWDAEIFLGYFAIVCRIFLNDRQVKFHAISALSHFGIILQIEQPCPLHHGTICLKLSRSTIPWESIITNMSFMYSIIASRIIVVIINKNCTNFITSIKSNSRASSHTCSRIVNTKCKIYHRTFQLISIIVTSQIFFIGTSCQQSSDQQRTY